MYDKGKIVPGILVFLGLFTAPFWWNPVFGKAGPAPQPKLPATETKCVLPKAEMRASHMQVIYDWRESVVRDGMRTYPHPDGSQRLMSLSNTCLGCHDNKKEFCDACHGYLAVKPFCWDCHFDPKEQA